MGWGEGSSDTSAHAKNISLDGVGGDGSMFIRSFIHSGLRVSFSQSDEFLISLASIQERKNHAAVLQLVVVSRR